MLSVSAKVCSKEMQEIPNSIDRDRNDCGCSYEQDDKKTNWPLYPGKSPNSGLEGHTTHIYIYIYFIYVYLWEPLSSHRFGLA